jgi:hypothetical protein
MPLWKFRKFLKILRIVQVQCQTFQKIYLFAQADCMKNGWNKNKAGCMKEGLVNTFKDLEVFSPVNKGMDLWAIGRLARLGLSFHPFSSNKIMIFQKLLIEKARYLLIIRNKFIKIIELMLMVMFWAKNLIVIKFLWKIFIRANTKKRLKFLKVACKFKLWKQFFGKLKIYLIIKRKEKAAHLFYKEKIISTYKKE